MDSQMGNIFVLRDCRTKRMSSYDRTGGNRDWVDIAAGETAVIAYIEGAGIIRHIWMTLWEKDPMLQRTGILRMYWDGETEPSVESPIGDFFGQGWGESYEYASLPMAASPAEGKALNCYFPMPFSKSARITIENDSDIPLNGFYFYIDYEEHDSIPQSAGRFHAWWNRELTTPEGDVENEGQLFGLEYKNTTGFENYLFADIEGKGHFVGINYYVDNPGVLWYGEGDDMWMIDGEKWPGSLHGTGTEDFFNTAWGPKKVFTHPYYGSPKVAEKTGWMGRTHCYRFFVEDPICFNLSLRGSIEHGHANVLTLDIATVAYWYQVEPHKTFPLLPGKEARQNMPTIDLADIHRWRHAWRKSMGGGKLWGTEK